MVPNPTPYFLNRVPVVKDDSYKSFMPNLLLKLPDPNMDFWSDSKVGSVKMLVVFGKKEKGYPPIAFWNGEKCVDSNAEKRKQGKKIIPRDRLRV